MGDQYLIVRTQIVGNPAWGMDDFEPNDCDDLAEINRQLGLPGALSSEVRDG